MKYISGNLAPAAVIPICMKNAFAVLALLAAMAPRLRLAQSVRAFIIDPSPAPAPLEKP